MTTGSLFEEMTGLSALAEYPDPGYRMVQYSSYDHRSTVPGGPDWFANDDGFGGEKIPNFESVPKEPDASGVGEYVMVDVAGPGAVVRLWTASISGKVRFYIDNMERPLYEGDADPFFRRPYDVLPEIKPIEGDVFRRTVYQRDASYAPFPFAKRLRIVWIGKTAEIHFYHIQVRLYDLGTKVRSFRPGDLDKYREIIDRVTAALSDPDGGAAVQTRRPAIKVEVSIPPGEKKELVALQGPGAVARLALRLRAGDLDRALRQTVLNVICDGAARPQVHSPVGDFFGAAPGVNPYESLPFSVKDDGTMICRFIMPFRTSLSIVLENRGDQAAEVTGEIVPADFTWDANSLHFYARWRVDHNLIASGEEVQDLPFVLARGRGVYVGTASILLNPAVVPSSWGNWWGEGDEKVFVDDDTRPSLFGTGSEDYYNYSWSSADIFSYPYCGQPRNDGPGNRGFVSNVRWHILDAIPFGRSLSFYMELFSHERTPGLSYARIGYYYGRPGTFDDHQAIMPEDLRPLALTEDLGAGRPVRGQKFRVFPGGRPVDGPRRHPDGCRRALGGRPDGRLDSGKNGGRENAGLRRGVFRPEETPPDRRPDPAGGENLDLARRPSSDSRGRRLGPRSFLRHGGVAPRFRPRTRGSRRGRAHAGPGVPGRRQSLRPARNRARFHLGPEGRVRGKRRPVPGNSEEERSICVGSYIPFSRP